jgi:enoyl-CoA hydratase / 3-hydroxyacyl-CoA dehydrogenase
MKLEDIKKIAVIGAGDMGHGIAQVALLTGYKVSMRDIEQRFVDKGLGRIKESLTKMTVRQKITTEDMQVMLNNFETSVDMGKAVKDADFVIEAVPEILELKKDTFKELDKLTPRHAILATNTSNMSITTIASMTSRPDKVVGMHFFNPAVIMKLVEVIRGSKTSDETMQLTYDLATKMKKIAVKVEKDSPGFIYNRVNAPGIIVLGGMIEKGLSKPDAIDAKMKKIGMPMGPYELLDYVGLDVAYHGALYFAEKLGSAYGPPAWLKEKVKKGELGKKTGKGIYDWSQGKPAIDTSKEAEDFDPTDLVVVQVNEGTKLIEEGVVKTADEIDKAMINGGNMPFGPFQIARGMGFDKIAKRCEELAQKFGADVLNPTETLKKGAI